MWVPRTGSRRHWRSRAGPGGSWSGNGITPGDRGPRAWLSNPRSPVDLLLGDALHRNLLLRGGLGLRARGGGELELDHGDLDRRGDLVEAAVGPAPGDHPQLAVAALGRVEGVLHVVVRADHR